MIVFNNKEISNVHYRNVITLSMAHVYRKMGSAVHTLWDAICSCFGSGYWIGRKPWVGTDAWKGKP